MRLRSSALVDRFNAAAEGLDAGILRSEVLPPSSLGGASAESCVDEIGAAMQDAPDN